MGIRFERAMYFVRGAMKLAAMIACSPFDRPTRARMMAAMACVDVYEIKPQLQRAALSELADADQPVQVARLCSERWQASVLEITTIVALIREHGGDNIFEIGTFDGRTTLNLHLNFPSATIHTVDLPPEKQTLPDGKVAGALIGDLVEAGKIRQVYGDSTTYDFSRFYGTQDAIFIDAGHGYECAMADTRTALKLLTGREGVIIWHDYANWAGVTQAVAESAALVDSAVKYRWIQGTSLACMITDPGRPLRLKQA